VNTVAFEHEQRRALHLLEGIENGTLSATESATLLDEADPALVYFIVTWLRTRYKDHPAGDGVIGRLVEVTNGANSVGAKMREGKADPIVEWFEDEYSYRELRAREFIAVVVEKLES